MQSLQVGTNFGDLSGRCADDTLAGVPAVMRFIRFEMRSHRSAPLSVPQFRALVFARVHENCSLSAMAEHLGLSLSAASRMTDLLVRRGLLQRRPGAPDRRNVSLSLTRRGASVYLIARRATHAALARRFETMTVNERRSIGRAMKLLQHVFGRGAANEIVRRPA